MRFGPQINNLKNEQDGKLLAKLWTLVYSPKMKMYFEAFQNNVPYISTFLESDEAKDLLFKIKEYKI